MDRGGLASSGCLREGSPRLPHDLPRNGRVRSEQPRRVFHAIEGGSYFQTTSRFMRFVSVCLRTHGCDLGAPFVALLAHTESLVLIHEYLACPDQEKAFEILEDCPLKQPSSAAVLAAQEITRSHVGRHEFRQEHRDGVQGAMAFIGRVRDGTVCLCEAQSCRLPLTSTTSMCWTQWCRAGLRMIKRLSIYVPTRLMRRRSCNDKTTPCCCRCSSHAIEMQCRHIAPAFESIFQSLIPFSLTSHLFTRGPSSNSHAIVSLVGRLFTQVSSTSILPITRRI
jgi:hypothetical protein